MRFTRGDVTISFHPNRSRISVVALKSDAAAEMPKDQLSRDFLGCSIFDFCNNIGTKRTFLCSRSMSDLGLRADIEQAGAGGFFLGVRGGAGGGLFRLLFAVANRRQATTIRRRSSLTLW